MAGTDKDKIEVAVTLATPVSRVWKALSDHKAFGRWFRVALDQPFEEGALSTGHMTYPGHEGIRWVAYIECVDPERLFSFRWYDAPEGSAEGSEGQPALLVEFRLEEIPEGTRLTISETGFAALPEPRRTELFRGNKDGWEVQAGNLTEYLSGRKSEARRGSLGGY